MASGERPPRGAGETERVARPVNPDRSVAGPGGFHTAREQARPEGLWYMRHEQMLERWPVLPEEWARQIEERRLEPLRNRDIAYLHGAGR